MECRRCAHIRWLRWRPGAQLTADGKLLWQTAMGEYPLYFALDSQNNTYGGGKSLLLYSWDGNGKLCWRQRTADTLNKGLGGVTSDGSYMVTHSFNGELAAYDGEGHVLWQRSAPVSSPAAPGGTGHQGLQITPDGEWTVLGVWDGTVVVLDRTGTVRWSYNSPDPPVTRPPARIATRARATRHKRSPSVAMESTSRSGSRTV